MQASRLRCVTAREQTLHPQLRQSATTSKFVIPACTIHHIQSSEALKGPKKKYRTAGHLYHARLCCYSEKCTTPPICTSLPDYVASIIVSLSNHYTCLSQFLAFFSDSKAFVLHDRRVCLGSSLNIPARSSIMTWIWIQV